MEFFSSESGIKTHVMALDPGDDVIESLKAMIASAGIRNGAVVSGIGTLDYCRLHMVTTTGYPAVEVFPEWNDTALELVSMQGVIADGVPHIHTTVSDKQSAVSGHMEPGCRVLYLCEVVVLEFVGMDLTRVPNHKDVLKIVQKSTAA
jgi:predicted DNA-binding protein with PD1-like motif